VDFYKTQRTAIFIDGAETIATCEALGFNIDFRRLRQLFQSKSRLQLAAFYTLRSNSSEETADKSLAGWLSYNGYAVFTKPARDVGGVVQSGMANSIAVDLAVDALSHSSRLDHIILFSPLADFRYLVESLQKEGLNVTVVSSRKAGENSVSDELTRQSDQFIELADIESEISLEPSTSTPISTTLPTRSPPGTDPQEP
jgi:uncharacterized LabA/DUF88 family protein